MASPLATPSTSTPPPLPSPVVPNGSHRSTPPPQLPPAIRIMSQPNPAQVQPLQPQTTLPQHSQTQQLPQQQTLAHAQAQPSLHQPTPSSYFSPAQQSLSKHHHHQHSLDTPKVVLKRSRSPFKMIRNIKSYLHSTKHSSWSHSSKGSDLGLGASSASTTQHQQPPPPQQQQQSQQANNYSIFSQPLPGSRPPRARQSSGSHLNSEQQVLLLRVMSYFDHCDLLADEEVAESLLQCYGWDIEQTLAYCHDLVEAVEGKLKHVQPTIVLQGAVNDLGSSCYIDALLFAMFARLRAFEGLLSVNLDGGESESDDGEDHSEDQRLRDVLNSHRMQTWLRVFINQLRSGKLVQTHVVRELRQHLNGCGWRNPSQGYQQEDSSELFMFLTDKLQLPYLPLEQRLLHGAKVSVDDERVVTERMLQICLPAPPPPPPQQSQISALVSNMARLGTSSSSSSSSSTFSASIPVERHSLEDLLNQHFYDNTLMDIRRTVSSGTGAPLSPGVEVPVSAWQVLELLPFYSSTNEQGGMINANKSQYPSDVVILPLILKRYSMGPDGITRRNGALIDIPRRIDFSRFVNAGSSDKKKKPPPLARLPTTSQYPSESFEPFTPPNSAPPSYTPSNAPEFLNLQDEKQLPSSGFFPMDGVNQRIYMLELKSVVCHVGAQLTQGHYRSYVSDEVDYDQDEPPPPMTPLTPKGPLSVRPHRSGTASSSRSAYGTGTGLDWLRHDDLDPSGHRVQLIRHGSDVEADMEKDWAANGYILLYALKALDLD